MARLDYEKAKRRQDVKDHDASWWWIPSRLAMMTCGCGKKVTRGSKVAYSHEAKTAICKDCARVQGIRPRASRAWLTRQAKA